MGKKESSKSSPSYLNAMVYGYLERLSTDLMCFPLLMKLRELRHGAVHNKALTHHVLCFLTVLNPNLMGSCRYACRYFCDLLREYGIRLTGFSCSQYNIFTHNDKITKVFYTKNRMQEVALWTNRLYVKGGKEFGWRNQEKFPYWVLT